MLYSTKTLKLAQVPPERNKKNSSRGLVLYGTTCAPSGFRPRAKPVKKPFKDDADAPPRQGSLLGFFSGAKAPAAPQPPATNSKQEQAAARKPPVRAAVADYRARDPEGAKSKSRAKYKKEYRARDPEGTKKKRREYLADCRARDPEGTKKKQREYMAEHRAKIGKAAVNARKRNTERIYMRAYRAADPDRYFHDTYQSSLIGRLRGTRPSALVDGLRKACTVPPAAVDDIFDHLKAQSPPRAKKWMNVSTWGKGQGKCELDHMLPKKLESGIKGVMGYQHTLEDIFREYNDDNMQAILGTDNRIKSNKLPSVPELDACRNTWPVHWGDVLPKAIPCPRGYEHLLTARPLAQQTFYSKLPRDPYYDADWIKSLCDLFGIEA